VLSSTDSSLTFSGGGVLAEGFDGFLTTGVFRGGLFTGISTGGNLTGGNLTGGGIFGVDPFVVVVVVAGTTPGSLGGGAGDSHLSHFLVKPSLNLQSIPFPDCFSV
tara:strand:+ start:4614 stop:4931 length:318 start_codon:yes stop_codon:yes gene_type:complete